MKLWLDDVRPCPFIGNWKIAKNYDEAVAIMSSYEIEEAWLDHDLAREHYEDKQTEEKTGYDFVLWMLENDKWPKDTCIVHSLNPVGAKRMCDIIAEHFGTPNPTKHYVPFLQIQSILKGIKDEQSYLDLHGPITHKGFS